MYAHTHTYMCKNRGAPRDGEVPGRGGGRGGGLLGALLWLLLFGYRICKRLKSMWTDSSTAARG